MILNVKFVVDFCFDLFYFIYFSFFFFFLFKDGTKLSKIIVMKQTNGIILINSCGAFLRFRLDSHQIKTFAILTTSDKLSPLVK